MNYIELGNQYLDEAAIIGSKVNSLRRDLRDNRERMSREEQANRYKRISMLYSMYLECNITGQHLIKRGQHI